MQWVSLHDARQDCSSEPEFSDETVRIPHPVIQTVARGWSLCVDGNIHRALGRIKVIVHISIYPIKYGASALSLPFPHPQQPSPS